MNIKQLFLGEPTYSSRTIWPNISLNHSYCRSVFGTSNPCFSQPSELSRRQDVVGIDLLLIEDHKLPEGSWESLGVAGRGHDPTRGENVCGYSPKAC